MKLFSQILSYALPLLYLGVIYFYYLIFTGKDKRLLNKTTGLLIGLLFIHAVEIISRLVALNAIPLSTTHDAFSFLAFSILFVYMILELSLKNKGSGLFILSFAFIFELVSSFNVSWTLETNPLLKDPSFAIHASVSIMGYTALALSALYALMYILQNRNIKKRNLGKLFMQLPAISYLEKMSARSVFIGIILLGIGILQGHLEAYDVMGSFWQNDIKVIVIDTIWIIYLIGYSASRLMRWRGIYMAYFSIFGFLVLILGGSMVIYVSESFHSFY
ncbi:MAG: cytochrome c biogenesis protein CcsA [Cyclobacteriaceae bacterium]|nr:cytochrome c biogenesis protein CcsA [Cyclobacteriaceae bacterium]